MSALPAPTFDNPFRPGAGHPPPHLAGREKSFEEFEVLLRQRPILDNLVITGLRGVGKTVLLDKFRPLAQQHGWRWVGTDMSEAASISETRIALRLLADLSVTTSSIEIGTTEKRRIGFGSSSSQKQTLDYKLLAHVFDNTPGLTSDKLKACLEFTWEVMDQSERGIIFAYDEAQNLSDHAEKNEFPLSLLLDVFQSIQKKNIPFMLVLTGLPTLFPKLVEARTYAERMFHVMELGRLDDAASREAIVVPVQTQNCPISMDEKSIKVIVGITKGYPYFIQFVCREVYDVFIAGQNRVPVDPITKKLDADFFAGRWQRATDRQRELMYVIAKLPTRGEEFTVQQARDMSESILDKPFSSSHISQMLAALATAGLVYKTNHGKYAFAVPLLGDFILRQGAPDGVLPTDGV